MTYAFEAPFVHFFSYRGNWYPEADIHHFHAYLYTIILHVYVFTNNAYISQTLYKCDILYFLLYFVFYATYFLN